VLYQFAEFARLADPYFRGVIEASLAIALVAFLDDLYDWPFTIKLSAQLLAALVAIASGLYVHEYRVPYVHGAYIAWLGPPLTLAWLLFATNAMNFIDGMNGLAGGVTLIAAAFLAGIAYAHGAWFAYAAGMLLAAGVTGFLPFNFPRARIFMGDVGSQFCGFMLAILAVVASRFDGVELSFLLVPMLLSGVLFDVAFTLARRWRAGERLTAPHRGHLYQVAQRAGIPATKVAAIHWAFAAYGGACCLAFLAAPSPAKPYVPLLTIPPQLVWLAVVTQAARRADLGRWG
jgi:UDP-GlcNAc:undecaprenyl-phosphate GlcNAc-1-phosphate transferase